ncbi:MAG: N-formylglutamate amidohydrolase [Rhizobiaceae bacterium]
MHAVVDTSPVSIVKGSPSAPFLFVCEHASPHMPEMFDNLGLDEAAAASHIAWDPGAFEVNERLSAHFRATAVCGTTSRLIYDLNRSPDAADAIPGRSEVFDVPGNQNLTSEQRSHRVETYYQPFQQALQREIAAYASPPALVTLHSFTPTYAGRQRQVEFGILHDADSRLADAMLSIAPDHTDLVTQRNQPYGPADGVTHTLIEHGLKNGLLNVMIEVRNDHLQSKQQCDHISSVLASWLEEALALSKSAPVPQEAKA